MSVIEKVKALILAHRVLIFSKTYCPFCAKAVSLLSHPHLLFFPPVKRSLITDVCLLTPKKRVLGQYKLKNYKVIELDECSDGDEMQRALKEITGGSTVPRVFVNHVFIGGGDDTEKLDREGKLKKLLQSADALE